MAGYELRMASLIARTRLATCMSLDIENRLELVDCEL